MPVGNEHVSYQCYCRYGIPSLGNYFTGFRLWLQFAQAGVPRRDSTGRHFRTGRFVCRVPVFTGPGCVDGHNADGIEHRQQEYRGDEYKCCEKIFIDALGTKTKD
jgi:hypothetical protein